MPSVVPRSQWAFGSKSSWRGVPTVRSQRLAVSSPTGTPASGRFGRACSMASSSGSRVWRRASSSSMRPLSWPTAAIASAASPPRFLTSPMARLASLRCRLRSSTSTRAARRSASSICQASSCAGLLLRLSRPWRTFSGSSRRRSRESMARGSLSQPPQRSIPLLRRNKQRVSDNIRPAVPGEAVRPPLGSMNEKTVPSSPRSEILRILAPLAALAAMASFAAREADPASAAESAYLAVLAVSALLPAGFLAPWPAWEVGIGSALAAAVVWALPPGPGRGAAMMVLLVAVLAVAAGRALYSPSPGEGGGRGRERGPGGEGPRILIPLALASQILLRGDLLFAPPPVPRLIVALIVLPVVGGI